MEQDEIIAAERQRISGIIGGEEAKGRAGLAAYFAFETDMTVEAANAALSKSPVTPEVNDAADVADLKARVDALTEENASLKANASSAQSKAIEELSSGAPKIESDDSDAGHGIDAKETRMQEARANARIAFGKKA
jgi:uncharacterized membrane protein